MNISHLQCLKCGAQEPFNFDLNLCPRCGIGGEDDPSILDVHYHYDKAAIEFKASIEKQNGNSLARFLPLLPLKTFIDVLPTGNTSLVPAAQLGFDLGFKNLWLKDETRNPTRSLKDRATAVFVGMAVENGLPEVYCSSAGNAAISLAGYSALAGLKAQVFVPNNVSKTRLDWLNRYGANVHVSSGNYDQAFAESEEIGKTKGWYSRNCAYNPYLVEGKKTVAFEIAQQLNFDAPDVVMAPVGDGCTLAAIGKGFRELRQIGLIDRIPKLIGVQAARLNPLVSRFEGEALKLEQTKASSIAVRKPRNALRLARELQESKGMLVSVDDEEMLVAQKELAQKAGLIAEVTSAASLAALKKLANKFTGEERIVIVVTGGRTDEA
jgi:threonine synthase